MWKKSESSWQKNMETNIYEIKNINKYIELEKIKFNEKWVFYQYVQNA